MTLIKPAVALISVATILFATQSLVTAQKPQLTSGITVAPAYVLAQVGSLQPEVNLSIGVKNNLSVPVTLNAELSGIDIQNNSLMPANKPDPILQTLTAITPSVFSLQPGESINIKVTISDKPNLSPGGHYLSVLVRQVSTNTQQLSLESAVNAIIYLIKEDGAIREVKLSQLDISRNLFRLPTSLDTTFTNPGNVSAVPRGLAGISRLNNGDNLSQGVINRDSVPLLPGQSLKLRTTLEQYKNPWLPGKYQLSVQYRYEGQDSTMAASSSFWYIPMYFLLLIPIFILTVYITINKKRRSNAVHILKRVKIKFVTKFKKIVKKRNKVKASKIKKSNTRKITIKFEDDDQPK